jgi:chromosome segregation ATPase
VTKRPSILKQLLALFYRLQAAVSERDMYKKMMREETIGRTDSEQLQAQISKYEETVKTYEATLESIRLETTRDVGHLKTELEESQKVATSLRRDIAQANAQIAHLQEKCDKLVNTSESRNAQISELRRLSTDLEQRLAARENMIHDLNEKLMASQTKEELMRNENTYITAEKNAQQELYERLKADNMRLETERSNSAKLLGELNANLRANTSESSQFVDHLKQQVERLERDLQHARDTIQSTERQLRDAQPADLHQWQKRYDESQVELRLLKETHSETTSKLRAANEQVTILTVRLQDAEKDIQRWKNQVELGTASTTTTSEDLVAQERDDHVKRLAAAQSEISLLQQRVDEYKASADSNEKALQDFIETHKNYSEGMEATLTKASEGITQRDSTISELRAELTSAFKTTQEANEQLSQAQQNWEKERSELTEQTSQIEEIKAQAAASVETIRAEMDIQLRLVHEAEQKYQTELTSRSQDQETIQSLRTEIDQKLLEINERKQESELAQSKLQNAEASWQRQKEQFEATQQELYTRFKESQEHEDKLAVQIQELMASLSTKFNASTNGVPNGMDIASLSDRVVQELREVNASLRRDKELLDVRLTDASQELQRTKGDMEYAQRLLKQTREALEEERKHRAASSAADRSKLESLNQAAAYKDSNDKLRELLKKMRSQIQDYEQRIITSDKEIEPLKRKFTRQLILAMSSHVATLTNTFHAKL